MTKISRLFILGFFVSWALSCAKGGGDSAGNNSNTATVNSVNCIENPQLCQPQVYNANGFSTYPAQPYGYGQYGYNQGYPYNSGSMYYGNGYVTAGAGPFHYMNNSAYLCNCPSGTMPTYNIYGGLGCVQNQVVGSFSGYAYFGYGATNNQWMNIPQISNYTGYTQQNCYNGVVQSCLTDQTGSCGSGYTCRATSAQSRMGLCVSSSQSSSGQIYR